MNKRLTMTCTSALLRQKEIPAYIGLFGRINLQTSNGKRSLIDKESANSNHNAAAEVLC